MALTSAKVAAARSAALSWWMHSLGGRYIHRLRELDLDTHALALGAQQVLCTAPLLVAVSAVVQHRSGHGIGFATARFFALNGDSADAVTRLFGRNSSAISTPALIVSLISAVVLSTGLAAVQQRAIELMWSIPRITGVRAYIRQLMWVPTIAGFAIVMLAATRVAGLVDESVPGGGEWVVGAARTLVIVGFYWWTQHWLLAGRITWRALLPGALAIGALTTVLIELSRVIMPSQMAWQVHAYGPVGGIFVLAIWLMILSMLIFAGVLFGAVMAQAADADEHRPYLRAMQPPETDTADRTGD